MIKQYNVREDGPGILLEKKMWFTKYEERWPVKGKQCIVNGDIKQNWQSCFYQDEHYSEREKKVFTLFAV